MILSKYNIPSLNLSQYAIKSRMWEHFVDAACDSLVAEWLGRWTCDQVASSNLGLSAIECNPGQFLTHMCLCHQSVFGTSQWAVIPCGWEGNCMSGVALATRHRHWWFSTYGLKA